MDLVLRRMQHNSWGVISSLETTSGDIIAVTLEHAYVQPDGSYAPKLNIGKHLCVLGPHNLDHSLGDKLYEITNVPGHSGILFHLGNYQRDSNGCVLVGTALGQQCVTGSKIAFNKFMSLQDGKNFNLEVVQ